MGSAGHAFIAHTKSLSPQPQSKDAGYGAPPHPVAARPGQLYWPRAQRVRRVLVVHRVAGDTVTLVSGKDARSSVPVARLLRVRADGQGRNFQFQGFMSRRYRTCAYVWDRDGDDAVLCVSEWHPRRPVRVPARLLPYDADRPGVWLTLTCDLSASSAARLQPADLRATAAPEPGAVHQPAIDAGQRRR